MSRLRIASIDEYQYLTCVKHSLWGSKSARFKDWQPGDYLAFIINKSFAGLAVVTGKPFHSKQKIWDKDLYPYRIPIKLEHILPTNLRIPILGEVRDVLTSAWGAKYGWGILNQQLLTDSAADIIIKQIKSRQNNVSEIKSNIDYYLEQARVNEKSQPQKRKRGRPPKILLETKPLFETKEEASIHSKAQASLIKLGKITGCDIWIASNDRKRPFKGSALGDGCIKTLPNLGLNEEATRRISLIDIIWLRQNAPVCAFEVEATTSIYSGLLRMSDLLSVVPAINIKLFIVASKERQDKVMSELSRPTFQKIGLSDFCRFIPIEDLDKLVAKINDLEGYIEPSVIDSISIELEQEL